MAVEVQYINTATGDFLDLQSGFARPYWEVNITVSGSASTVSATLGQAYSSNNRIIEMSPIDRERPIIVSGLSRVIAGDLTVTLNNISGLYSPMATASIFTDNAGTAHDYFNSIINVHAGFEAVSGTAFVLKRGTFLLTRISVDSKNQQATLYCEDAAKTPLQKYIGLPGLSGTATPFTIPTSTSTQQIIKEILSGIGLSASQYDLVTGINYSGYSVTSERASDAIGKLAQRSEGYIATDNQGRIVFANLTSTGGVGSVANITLKDNDRVKSLKQEVDLRNIINKVQVTYSSGTQTRSAEDTTITKGRQQIITNSYINQPSIANALASRVLGEFKYPRYFIELDNVWLPSLDVRNSINIWDSNTFQTSVSYEIYRIRDDIVNCSTKIYAINDILIRKKFGYCSDISAVNCGTVFTDSWHSGFAFACRETTTAVNPAFDADGNNNNVINTGYAASGAGTTGIELAFEVQ